ncbi:MAG TPA: hypothetical protein VL021_11680 [Brumimicrobium sp.]|nr:hypothetical protein [Brumimicrobium sp.]
MFVVSETYYFNNELETTFEGILKMMLIQPLLVKKQYFQDGKNH